MSAKAFEALSKSSDVSSVPQTAQSQVNQDDEDRKKLLAIRKKNLIRFGSLAVLAFVVWLFATIAWFSSNKDVGAGGMGVKVATIPFELSSTGTVTQEYLDLFEFADDTYGEGAPVTDAADTYSTKGSSKLIWRLDAGNNGDSYIDGFRPGASGTLTFKIVPNVDEELYVDCKFSVRTFAATYDENDEDEIESLDEVNLTTGTDDQKAAFRYLNSHILFFENRSVSDNIETYSGFIGSDGLKVHIPANTPAGQTVTVYWKWVNTIDQLFLKSTDEYEDFPLFADDNNDDRNDAIDYINEKYDDIFAEMTNAASDVFEADGISYSYVTASANASFLSAILDNYNTADQIIGQNVDYFLLEMSAERGASPSEP